MCLASPAPMQVWWGPSLAMIYNDAAIGLVGPHTDALGRPALEILGERYRSLRDEVGRLRAEQSFVRCGDLTLTPLFDEDGAIAGISCTSTMAHQERAAQLEAIALEVRNPLTLVLGPLDEMLASNDDIIGVPREALEVVQRGALRSDKLLSALLDIARIDAGLAVATYEPTPIGLLTAEIAETFRPLLETSGVRLVVTNEIGDDRAHIAPHLWQKIIADLLAHAFQSTADGELDVTVRSGADGVVEVEVSDTGIPLEPDQLARAFDRSFRRKAVRPGGPDLGLAVVRELVQAHGATIEVSTTPERGSKVVISVRRRCDHLPAPQVRHESSVRQGAADHLSRVVWWPSQRHNQVPEAVDPKRPRVLVVEDDPEMRDYIASLLGAEWQITDAASGLDGLAKAASDPPDIVISDVMMPELDGLSLLRALRGNPRTSGLPVILLTARSGDAAKAEGIEAGADDYLVKPFSSRELRARVRIQLELAQGRRDAKRIADSAMNEFLAMVGHQLRNPLSTVSTMLQALLMQQPSKEIELMGRAVRLLTRLVEDLLESSRLSRGGVELQRQVVELAQVLDRAVELATPALEDKRIAISSSLPRTGYRIEADPDRLARALGNVITNAAQHSASGTTVTISAVRDGDHVRLTVADRGSGIAADRLGTVFQSFKVADPTSLGLGLGLTIARNLVELHGGSISLSSDGVGQGTQCTIELATTAAEAETAAPVVAARRRRLLLVEDSDDTALALKAALEQLGYEVALAHNGPIAINLARSYQPDVALLDLGLPVMDGWELAKRIRGAAGDVPIVAVTARDQESDKRRSAELGFTDHLVKPIDLKQLARLVDSLPLNDAPR